MARSSARARARAHARAHARPSWADDPVALCARAQARFYRLAYAALGVRQRRGHGWWWVDVEAPSVFPVAGTLRAQAAADAVLRRLPPTGRLVVSDAWACLDLAGLGLVSRPGDPWMLRSAGAALPEIGAVPDLEILRASTPDEVRSVEATIISAAGVVPPGYRPESIHAPQGSLEQTDLHLFLGLYRGVPMATAMAAVARHVVFVSGVSTMTSVRGRGIATAMTLAAMAVAPDRPAALATTSMGRPIYERLGFEIVGRPVTWHRAAS